MKILMESCAMGPGISNLPGKTYDIDPKTAKLWAEGRYCKLLEEPKENEIEAKMEQIEPEKEGFEPIIETEMLEIEGKAVLKMPANKVISKKQKR